MPVPCAYQLKLPTGVKTIDKEAFYGDTSLDEVVLPEGIKSIGARAFANSSVKKINLPGSLTTINSTAFDGTTLSQITANWNTKGSKWAIEHGIKLVTPASSMSFSSAATLTSSPGYKTDVTAYINQVFTAHDAVGGGFSFIAPTGGRYTFSVKAPSVAETFKLHIYATRNGTLTKIKEFTYEKSNDIVTYVLPDVVAGETICWWDGKTSNTGHTAQSDFLLKIGAYDSNSEPALTGGFTTTELEVEQGAPIHLPIELTCQNGLITDIYVSSDYDYSWWLGLPSPVSTYSDQINIPLDQLSDQPNHSVSIFVTYSSLDGNQQYGQWMSTIEITQTASGQEEQDDIIYPDSILLDRHEMTIKIGDRVPNSASLTSSADITPEAAAITWTSSDTAIAAVSDGGMIEAKSAGSAVITAQTVNGLCDYCFVTVEPDVQITGGFDEETIGIFVPDQGELRYHVNAQYGTIESVKLKYGSRYLLENQHTDQTSVSYRFIITTGTKGIFDSEGVKTVSLIAEASDGTEFDLGTARIYVKYDYPTRVIGVSANYSSGKIIVHWYNNGDATRYKIAYSDGRNVQSVDVNDPEATSGTITGITVGKIYDIYVYAFNESGRGVPSPKSEVVRVMTSDDSVPAISARFVGGQTVYAPGEPINIEVSYGNIVKFHYQNYDHDYNPNGYVTSKYNGDYPGENPWSSNLTGSTTVQLIAQSTPGNYCVEIFARNLAGTAATNSYNYTMAVGTRCLMLTYTVQTGGLEAPTWYEITPRSTVENAYYFSEVSNATGYKIYRSAASDPSHAEQIGTVKAPPFVNNEPTGTSFYYVQAYNSAGVGPMSSGKRVDVRTISLPTVSAVLDKQVYKPGEDIFLSITYSNIKKVHYSNGDNDYNPYSYEEGILHCGDIWADDVAQETADFDISGSTTVKLKAQMVPGEYHIQIWAKNKDNSPATSSYNGRPYFELTYPVSSSPITSENTYYENLRLVPDGEDAFDYIPDLDEYLITELKNNGISESKAVNIVNRVKTAPQIYRDIYLWTFFDYSLEFSGEDTSWYNEKDNTMYIEDTVSLATWFHEAGHAADFTATGSWFSKSKYQYILYKAMEDRIGAEVSILISRKDEDGNYQLTENEKNAIFYNIMGPSYFILHEIGMGTASQGLINQGYSVVAPGWFNDKQKAVFYAAVSELQTRANNRGSSSDEMYVDMLAGFTNNVGTLDGHGPVLAYEYEKVKNIRDKNGGLVYDYDFWYNGSGGPTYYQNVEAWAEFYSSMFTKGENNNINISDFPAACYVMQNMAVEMLDICKSKH